VALLVPPATAHARGALMGIRAFMRESRAWSISLAEMGNTHATPSLLKSWQPDGIIVRMERPNVRRLLRGFRDVPIVEISGHSEDDPFPVVRSIDPQVGRMGAQHLLEMGFKDLAFMTDSRYLWARQRHRGFVEQAEAAGARVYELDRSTWMSSKGGLARERRMLLDWVRGLPDVVAVMASNDIFAQQIIEVAHECGREIPDRMAVLGVDDDDLVCDLTDPPLSSVALDTYRLGYTAAQMLDALMDGQTLDRTIYEVEPLGVTRRRSTDAVIVDDSELLRSLSYIREHACEGITVRDVLRQVPLTRRVLDARMLRHVGHTAYEEILRVKINRAAVLLGDTTLPLSTVARYCGFKEAECLNVAFKRVMGTTPGRYRTKRNTGLVKPRNGRASTPSRRKQSA
jgi:LacI family transcriptional regulator